MTKIIIDTDPGIDDAMAILFAFCHPDLEVLGLTTIFGNVPTELATTNALSICEAAGVDVPVCQGETTALAGPPRPYPDWVHGKNGLGGISWPAAARSADSRHAVDFIAEEVRKDPGGVTLVPVGPLTNIARLCERHPDVVPMVKEVVIMGGSARRKGNVTKYAEANIANDPEGADVVMAANWKATMVGLDVTIDTIVDSKDFAKIKSAGSSYGAVLAETAEYYIDFYSREVKVAGCCMHDVCAVALPVRPELFGLTKARIRVETEGERRGKTVAMTDDDVDGQWMDRPVQAFASKVDAQGMRDLFVSTLAG